MTRISAQAEESRSDTIIVSLPPEADTSFARKALELSLHDNGIIGEILIDKQNRQAHQGNAQRHRRPGDKSSFTIVPKGDETTLADIVKRVQEEVDPISMGGVKVTFQNNKSEPTTFLEKVQQCVAAKATCQLRKGSVIVQDIEAALSEKEILSILAEELGVPVTRLEAGKISNSYRCRSLVVTMSCDLADRAVKLKHIKQCWTRAHIREKIDPDFCDYCQVYEHHSWNSKIKIRQPRRCYNCGERGHIK